MTRDGDGKRLRELGVRTEEVLPNVFHLSFTSHRKMIDTFMRFREYFESSQFKGKRIRLSEFKDWYAQAFGDGNFQYANDWAAFNFPSEVLRSFEKKHPILYGNERKLVEFVRSLDADSYLIATASSVSGHAGYLKHEIAHAMFATDPEYRKKVKAILKTLDLRPIYTWLEKENYHSDRYLDEAHSYLLDGSTSIKRDLKIDPAPYRGAIKRLKSLFRKHFQRNSVVKV